MFHFKKYLLYPFFIKNPKLRKYWFQMSLLNSVSGSECVGGVGSVGALVCGWHGSNFGVGGVGL